MKKLIEKYMSKKNKYLPGWFTKAKEKWYLERTYRCSMSIKIPFTIYKGEMFNYSISPIITGISNITVNSLSLVDEVPKKAGRRKAVKKGNTKETDKVDIKGNVVLTITANNNSGFSRISYDYKCFDLKGNKLIRDVLPCPDECVPKNNAYYKIDSKDWKVITELISCKNYTHFFKLAMSLSHIVKDIAFDYKYIKTPAYLKRLKNIVTRENNPVQMHGNK